MEFNPAEQTDFNEVPTFHPISIQPEPSTDVIEAPVFHPVSLNCVPVPLLETPTFHPMIIKSASSISTAHIEGETELISADDCGNGPDDESDVNCNEEQDASCSTLPNEGQFNTSELSNITEIDEEWNSYINSLQNEFDCLDFGGDDGDVEIDWGVEEKHGMEHVETGFVGERNNLSNPLYKGAEQSVAMAVYAVMSFAIRHSLRAHS